MSDLKYGGEYPCYAEVQGEVTENELIDLIFHIENYQRQKGKHGDIGTMAIQISQVLQERQFNQNGINTDDKAIQKIKTTVNRFNVKE